MVIRMKTVFTFFKEAFRAYKKEFVVALMMAIFSAAYGVFIPIASKYFMQMVSVNSDWTLIVQGAVVFIGL